MKEALSTCYVFLLGYKCPHRTTPGVEGKQGHGGCVQALQAFGETSVMCRDGHLYPLSNTRIPVYTWAED